MKASINSLIAHRRGLIALMALMSCAMPFLVRAQTPPEDIVLTIAGVGVKRVTDSKVPQTGAAASPDTAEFTLAALAALPQHTISTTAPWHDGERSYSGPLLRDVLAAANARATQARFVALNDYKIDIPLEDAQLFPVVLAIRLDGKPMLVRDKGPLFVMYPFDKHPELKQTKYYSRCVWQLRRIELK
jgi:hypothetical protein